MKIISVDQRLQRVEVDNDRGKRISYTVCFDDEIEVVWRMKLRGKQRTSQMARRIKTTSATGRRIVAALASDKGSAE